MGSNPSKSQQLSAMFPQLKIMPEFTVQPNNTYQLIYVSKLKTNQIFIIKESIRQPNQKYIPKSQNVVKFYQCRKIDSMFYSLYEWVPQSLDRFIETNSQTVNRNFAIYIIQTLIKIYAMLWRSSEGNGLDIVSENVRVTRNSTGGVCVKVLPPYVTQCSFPQRKVSYRNRIQDLGQVLYSIFKTKQRQIGNNLIGFIVNKVKGFTLATNSINWEILQKEAQKLTPQYQISVQQLNNFKYSNIPMIGKQNRERSISPIRNQQIKRQVILNYSPIKTSQMPVPYQISTSPRDLSPQISRVCNYNPQKSKNSIHQVHTNNLRPISPYSIPNNHNISLVQNTPLSNNNNNVYFKTNPQLNIQNLNNFVPVKYQTQHCQKNQKPNQNAYLCQTGLIINQNYQRNRLGSPINTPQNLNKTQNKVQPSVNIEIDNNQNQSYLSGENVLGSQVAPSPMRYFPSTSSPSITPDKKNLIKNQGLKNVSNFNPYQIKPQTSLQFQAKGKIIAQKIINEKYHTQEKRKQNIMGLNANIRAINTENKNIPNTQINNKTQERPKMEIKQNKINKLNLYPLFQPSSPDLLQIRPKSGIPDLNYIPKTKQDRHVMEEISQSNKGSLNLKSQQGDFAIKNLIKDNKNARQLLGSSIPVAVDKSSSFGLTISQDSQVGNYDGIYQGSYHPTFPNMKHGVGKLIFPSGGCYQGNFSWNKMDGWGKLFYPSGRLAYEGFWKNNKFQGYGKLFNQSPLHQQLFDYRNFNKIQQQNEEGYWKYYQGNMKNDMKEGHGIWVLENGQKYDGQFHQDMVHGIGTFYGKKQSVEGVWENNILVKMIKKF